MIGISHAQLITHEGSTGAYNHSQGKCASAWQFVDGKRPASCAKYSQNRQPSIDRTNIRSLATVYSLGHEGVKLLDRSYNGSYCLIHACTNTTVQAFFVHSLIYKYIFFFLNDQISVENSNSPSILSLEQTKIAYIYLS